MPNINGIELVKSIYKLNSEQKIIIVSAYENKEYFIPLLKLGIEDFLQKPLLLENVMDTLSNIITKYWFDTKISLGNNYIYSNANIDHNDTMIPLTYNENRLLELLLSDKDRFFTLEEIHRFIFIEDPFKTFSAEAIRSILKRIRKKLPPKIILNNRTLGYKIELKDKDN